MSSFRPGFSTRIGIKNQFQYPSPGDRPGLKKSLERGFVSAKAQCQGPCEDQLQVGSTNIRNLDRGSSRLR